jgi:hypothetical protein
MHGARTVHAGNMPCIAHLPSSHARYIQDGTCICTANARHTHTACVVYTRFVCSPCVAYAHGTCTCTPIHDTIMTRPRAHVHENAQRKSMHMVFTAMYMRSMQASISCTVEARRTYIILMHGTCLTQGNIPCTVHAHHSYARHALSTYSEQSGHMHFTWIYTAHAFHMHIRHMQHDVCRLQHHMPVKCPAHARHYTLTNDSRIWQCHRHYAYRAHTTSAGKIAQHPCICNISGKYKRYAHTVHTTLVWYVHGTCTAHERRGTWAVLARYMQYSMNDTCTARVHSFLRC